ncbi:Co-chaperone Hsc20 [Xylariaceae sp. FL0594]|nr:Co-chaperone Hsc20 [Xylariaceae sp. FL0594]
MWLSLLPSRQANRICASCRQQVQLQLQPRQASSGPTARNLHTSLGERRRRHQQQQQQCDRSSIRTSSDGQRSRCHAQVTATQRRPFSHSGRGLAANKQSTGEASAKTADAQKGEEKDQDNTEAKEDDERQQPRMPPRTHYDFFPKTLPSGPPPRGRFAIDVRALRREFLALQSGAHPDLHPSHMKARAQAASARINEAFKTLADPLLRAQYVLALRGLDVAADERAQVTDPDLLLQVLEIRELIEEAEEEGELEAVRAENEERISACEDNLEDAFARDDLQAAKEEVTRLRYWMNVRETIDNWEKGKPVVLEH